MSPPVVNDAPFESLAVTTILIVLSFNVDVDSKPVTIELAALAPVRVR